MPKGIYKHKLKGPHSEDTKKKISKKLTGFKRPTRTEEHKMKHSFSLIGKKYPNRKLPPPFTDEHLKRMHKFIIGHLTTDKTKRKISESNKGIKNGMYGKLGDKNPNWIKDRTKLQKSEEDRISSACNYWKKEVKIRDNKKCRLLNNKCNGQLEVHHIFNWEEYPELRYLITNGILLCHFHHPRGREEEKRMILIFQELLSIS